MTMIWMNYALCREERKKDRLMRDKGRMQAKRET